MWRRQVIVIGQQQVGDRLTKIRDFSLILFFRLAFPGILNWQKRVWLTLMNFHKVRSGDDLEQTPEFDSEDAKMFDARNYFLKEATFNYKYSHQLSVAISKMQGLTNSIRVSKFLVF